MKVLHVIPSFYPAHVYGGPIQSVYALCRHLSRIGNDVRVLTTDANGAHDVLKIEKGRDLTLEDGVRVRYCRRISPQSTSPELALSVNSYVRWADIVHVTAIYNFPIIPALVAAKWNDKPVVWSPRGSLDRRLGRKNWLKPAWDSACKALAPKRITLHVTSQEEAANAAVLFPNYSTSLIPNGVEVPERDRARARPSDDCLHLLHIGRYHPSKAIEKLLYACAHLRRSRPNLKWRLKLAGNEHGSYSRKIRSLITELGLELQVEMVGEVTGEQRELLFDWSDTLVIPSDGENFGMVVAEALARCVPVIASRRTPWQQLDAKSCGLWVDNAPDSLADAIECMSALPLTVMGDNGRRWMNESYSWSGIAAQMSTLYRSVTHDESSRDGRVRVEERGGRAVSSLSHSGSR